MRKRYAFPGLVLIGLLAAFVLAGCDTNQGALAPEKATVSAGTEQTAVKYFVDETGTIYKARVTIEGIRVIAICDYPWDFMGPIPDGHDRMPPPSYPRDYTSQKLKVGSVIPRWSADNDGVVLHK